MFLRVLHMFFFIFELLIFVFDLQNLQIYKIPSSIFKTQPIFFIEFMFWRRTKKNVQAYKKKMCLFFKPKRLTFIYFCSKIVVLRKKIDSKVKKFRWLDSPSNGFDGWICGADSNNPWGRFEGQLDYSHVRCFDMCFCVLRLPC